MRIVIDLQGAQGTSRHRGIGRYSLALSLALARNRGSHEVLVLLNDAFPDTADSLRAAFEDVLPRENILVWHAPPRVSALESANTRRRLIAESIRESFIASLAPDMVVVTSLFEGLTDGAVTSIKRHSSPPTAVVLYDLIPLIYRDLYLNNPNVERWYREKLEQLGDADLLLSISASAGQEAVEHLHVPDDRVVNISTACDPHFRPVVVGREHREKLRDRYGLQRDFVMYTGGVDHRKNIEGLIRGYAGLPATMRQSHQLAIVCSVQSSDQQALTRLARQVGLRADELVLTGFVPEDDLLLLYNACKLFVFPSWHEGFGLPALEAMQCGRAVIAANTSSLPEVVGREDVLFDPHKEDSITAKLAQVLQDSTFRQALQEHGPRQARKFSWDLTAQRALTGMEQWLQAHAASPSADVPISAKLRLAYVSPLPPERSGISDYSAELLRVLCDWYTVDVVVVQAEVTDPWVRTHCTVRDVAQFRANRDTYDHVLYHFGNSHFHQHMFDLLEEIPGVVVLHDFYLSHILAHLDLSGEQPHIWTRALQASHGYPATHHRFTTAQPEDAIWAYPANLQVLQSAVGVIVHGESSRVLADRWYGLGSSGDWAVIPMLRAPAQTRDRAAARRRLGVAEDAFLICSFGLLGPNKLNARLLDAFLASPLVQDSDAHLVFVGENHKGDYGKELEATIAASGIAGRIGITGWADEETFRAYLAAADVAVQLRTLSRGETSAAVLDCMRYGLATVVNAHGSMADLDPEGVWMVPDDFSNEELAGALATLWADAARRQALGARALEIVRTRHDPQECAAMYARTMQAMYRRADAGLQGVLSRVDRVSLGEADTASVASALARNFPPSPRQRQLLVDVSELAQRDARTGIQRVTRAILREWLLRSPPGWIVEPVYAVADAPGYRYARRFTSSFLGMQDAWAEDLPVDAWRGDVFIGLDLQPAVVPAQESSLKQWARSGVDVRFVVYDLLPLLLPDTCDPATPPLFRRWLDTVTSFDGLVCISRAVADELRGWVSTAPIRSGRLPDISWFHLGADIGNSSPSTGMPRDAKEVLMQLAANPSFLVVGTVEPRKAHDQVLAAFEALWRRGVDLNLVVVGKRGWRVDELVERLKTHPERGKRLFWLDGISDEYLERVYDASSCLIAASLGEGFGLPLIEAAQHRLPVIARDIPVFREIAGDGASYFSGHSAEDLAEAIQRWLASGGPAPAAIQRLTWKESAQALLRAIGLPNSVDSENYLPA